MRLDTGNGAVFSESSECQGSSYEHSNYVEGQV
jgi:hypothetical protein